MKNRQRVTAYDQYGHPIYHPVLSKEIEEKIIQEAMDQKAKKITLEEAFKVVEKIEKKLEEKEQCICLEDNKMTQALCSLHGPKQPNAECPHRTNGLICGKCWLEKYTSPPIESAAAEEEWEKKFDEEYGTANDYPEINRLRLKDFIRHLLQANTKQVAREIVDELMNISTMPAHKFR